MISVILKIILGLAALFALYQIFSVRKIFPVLIGLGLIAGMIMVILPFLHLKETGMYVYLGFNFLAIIYGILAKGKSVLQRIVLILTPAGILTFWIWRHNHWHGNTLLLCYLVLALAVVALLFRKKFKNELGYIILLGADAFTVLLEYFMRGK